MYTSQLDVMISALESGSYSPPAEVARNFKQQRISAVAKALGLTNLFVPVAGHFPQRSASSTFTLYTKPLQRDVIVMGCALMALDQSTDTWSRALTEFRLRLPEPLSHLSQNYIFPQMAFAPGLYSVFFPAPFILPASEQIAVDFGWNAPQAGPFVDETGRIELVLFCAAVKNCLNDEDRDILRRAITVINDNDYQRRVLLNSVTQSSVAVTSQTDSPFFSGLGNTVVYPQQPLSSVVVPSGSLTQSETRQADVPLLVIGLAINETSGIRITDTGSGHSFTQGDLIYAGNLYYANSVPPTERVVFTTPGPYLSYFRLPIPHLLRPGATLVAEHVAEGQPFNPTYMVWECLTP
jgi:hypothetical protein